ncbi:hypothetical protein, partial [Neisseria meningitidis]|uniref:hypothetical protein n=2 Tax=Neisseria meningitidis TaxID=487 RepID=UPI001A7E181D
DLDSRLRGNDGGAVSVAPDKFLKLKISSFPQKQKTKNSNLKFVIPTKVGIQNAKSKETVLPDKFPYRQTWIPACAGMTKLSFWLKVKNQPSPSIT